MNTKSEVGDNIHVEYTIGKVMEKELKIYRLTKSGCRVGAVIDIDSPAIVKHIPKPPEPIKVGDTIRFTRSNFSDFYTDGTVLGIFEDRLWVKFPECSVPISPLTISIERVPAK